MTRQLVLDLPLRAVLGREAFFVSPSNAAALAAVEAWQDWPGGRLVLAGPPGSGKSHLVQVFAAAVPGAAVVRAGDLPGADIAVLAARPAVAVEDADRIAGNAAAETALFHLHNLVLAEGGRLLVTGALPPRDWGLSLPDIASRMQAAQMVRLEPPCDRLLAAVMVKLFADRQVAVAPAVIAYALPRMERSLAAAGRLVDRLDRLALARGQAVTRGLAAEVLDMRLFPDDDADDPFSGPP